MKSVTLIMLAISLVSCGKFATNKDLNKVKGRVKTLEEKVVEIQAKVTANQSSITNLSVSLAAQTNALNDLQSDLEAADADQAAAFQTAINQGTAAYNSLNAMIVTLQSQTTSLLASQAALETENRVVGMYDPCPSVHSNDFKESFFQLSNGEYVAYFESGSQRFLTVLKLGVTYQTTDSRHCVFSL